MHERGNSQHAQHECAASRAGAARHSSEQKALRLSQHEMSQTCHAKRCTECGWSVQARKHSAVEGAKSCRVSTHTVCAMYTRLGGEVQVSQPALAHVNVVY